MIVPTLKYSQTIYEDMLKKYVNDKTKWLDLGCGHQVLPPWRLEEEKRLVATCKQAVGIDYDMRSLMQHATLKNRLRGDISNLPLKNDCFTLVSANMVMEHIESPEKQFKEIYRVLNPGGVVIFHTPRYSCSISLVRIVPDFAKIKLIKLLQGREEADVFPTHYRINTLDRIAEVAKRTGFEIVKLRMIETESTFALIPPLAIIHLLFIRMKLLRPFKSFRSNIITILQKP
ncbi:MAG: class I SAM-dependent methyltransferase [Thermodesulfobacteriota bacterium]|nr:class I SAM-dependent methyltransferase [Thermodesulfobacteriota bacterium]